METFPSDEACPAFVPEAGAACEGAPLVCFYCDDPDYDEPYYGDGTAPWIAFDCGPQSQWRDITPGIACGR